jgi:hypothetical protein
MEKKQTAVEWLVEQLNKENFAQVVTEEEIKQAKEIERRQIKDAYSAGVWEIGCFNRNPDAKKYYEENYQEL